ncbi:MAG: class I SAM-dependent methyltransferase [Blastocatellia bacterium]
MHLVNTLNSLSNHPDKLKWDQKYLATTKTNFLPHPILDELTKLSLPAAPILELACGLSGNVLSLASLGYSVIGIDISEVALELLAKAAREKNLESKITLLQADLSRWQAKKNSFALVLGLKYWEKSCFLSACGSVIKGGFIAWETFSQKHLCYHPCFRSEWCLENDEPRKYLPKNFSILIEQDIDNGQTSTRRLIAKHY